VVMFNELVFNKKYTNRNLPNTSVQQKRPPDSEEEHGTEVVSPYVSRRTSSVEPSTIKNDKNKSYSSLRSSASVVVIQKLFQDHVESIANDPLIMRNIPVYYSILSGHLQDSLDDVVAHAKARKQE